MGDITKREDIEIFMAVFYSYLLKDEILGEIFSLHLSHTLEEHLPMLTDFWENILLTPNNYRKNVMLVHLDLYKKYPLEKLHFDRWLYWFEFSLYELYKGQIADLAMQRAKNIAGLMQIKLGIS
jgi:hemoglobin